MAVNYGSKRVVVGAHYGVRDFMAQRVTAALMVIFTFIVLFKILLTSGPMGYEAWAGIFAAQWMKTLTFSVIVALFYHVWVGVRDIWMDYVKPLALRVMLHTLTAVWLTGSLVYMIKVVWGAQ